MAMDEAFQPNPLEQGDLICSETGECSIVLTSITTQIKAGEIYYLSFFPYSFSNIVAGSKYFLFASLNIPIT